jgi:signal transduction histidine kinase/ligand-binding sensor domain-containing protein/AraC-like DNA-binding protein
MLKKWLTLLLILLSGILNGFSQNRSFNKILTQDGEENLSVRQIMQDKHGFLWLATFNGLYRYKGDDYIVRHEFKDKIEINSDVTAIAQDQENNIWIGTNNGLLKYNVITEDIVTYFSDIKDSLTLSDDKIRCLEVDQQGRIWIGTREGGLNVYDPVKDGFVRVTLVNEGVSINMPSYVKCILSAKDGKIWMGTWQNGLYCLEVSDTKIKAVQNYRVEDAEHPLSHNYVYCLYEDTDGKIVAGTRNGLNVYEPATGKIESYHLSGGTSQSKMNNIFRSVIRIENQKLWIGTWDGLIICDRFQDLESGDFELILHDRKNAHSISHDQIMGVFQDKSGSIWIGTENGLNNYDPYQNQFQRLTDNVIEDLSEQTATAFFPYKDGMLILTLSNGLIFKNQYGTQYLPTNNGFAQFKEKLYSLVVDDKDNIWVGTYNGLLIKMDARTQRFSTYKYSDDRVPIYAIEAAKDGTVLVGTNGEGLKYFHPDTEKFTSQTGLSGSVNINDVHLGKNGTLWIAAEVGIFRQKAGDDFFENYLPDNNNEILYPNVFIDIAESEEGEIFVGGRNGLYKYETSLNTFSAVEFANAERLWVTNIDFDDTRNMWLNLNFNRIAKWDRKSDDLDYFNINNGIRSSQYNRRGFYINQQDVLYLSGFDQIYQFNTSVTIENNYSPTPVFTSFTINNTDVHVGTKINNQEVLTQNINQTPGITLSNRNKDFTLSFTTTSYLNKSDNRYKYKLHGYDKDWYTGSQHTAHYTNLSPGKYSFEAYAANNDGIWSSEPAILSIRIKPSPLLSARAIFLYAIIFVVAFYQIRKIILARIRLKQELLIERVKRDNEDKFHQERLQFYTNISHELRTPLTLIMGPIKQLIDEEKEDKSKIKLQQFVLNNAQRLLSLVNQLLDFRKSVYQGMKLKVTYSNIVEVVKSTLQAFEFMAREKVIQTEFKTYDQSIFGWFDQEKLDIILFNILSNAYKYTPEQGLINIDLNVSAANARYKFEHIELRITNTGKGIEKNEQDKVFDRFYRGDGKGESTHTGTGIGLSLVKNLVELHHGIITLESEPGKSTTFIVVLPLKKSEYTDDEIFDFKRDANRRTRELIKYTKPLNEKSGLAADMKNKKRIVVIEDNYELREFLYGFLSEEYQVYTANNGKEGLKVCEKENPDIVVSDIMMDKMDGLLFCEKLKSSPAISHIPVILMTALASVENKIEGYKMGADDYITKPFEPELLKIRVRNILNNREKLISGYKNDFSITPKELTLSKPDEDLIQNIIDFVEKHIDNSGLNKDMLCKELGVSYSYLYRKLKHIVGTSPTDFVQSLRLKKAAQMLSQTDLNVSEVAYKVGYNDALYFSKCFKKQFGASPSNYLQS